MTKADVQTAVFNALRVAELALACGASGFSSNDNPFKAISGFDSLASVEVTTTICVSLGITDTKRNPFLENSGMSSLGQIVDKFCALAGAKEA